MIERIAHVDKTPLLAMKRQNTKPRMPKTASLCYYLKGGGKWSFFKGKQCLCFIVYALSLIQKKRKRIGACKQDFLSLQMIESPPRIHPIVPYCRKVTVL